MNTLFIIGNGFDLAHGLETGYDQFLFWLIKNELISAVEQYDGNINCKNTDSQIISSYRIGEQFYNMSREAFIGGALHQINATENISDIVESILKSNHLIEEIIIKNDIIRVSLERFKLTNWSDIEWQYFDLLRSAPEDALHLNQSLDYIKKELRTYLSEVNDTENNLDAYRYIIAENAGNEDLYLNFNYTSTLTDYHFSGREIQIHGSVLEDETNELVFGYGDETTEEYKKLENANDNNYLRNIKSVNYMSNHHYLDLFSFINDPLGKSIPKDFKANFNVVILGHSCGLSDRVLLKEIFEHRNCKLIKVYHHDGKNGFLQTTMNISRHFDENVNMRTKIQTFNAKYRMPQWYDELDL
jgi:hypothetical protein